MTLVARLSPEMAAAQWQKDGQTLRSGGRLLVCSEGPARSLTIRQAELGDSGIFICDAGDDEVHFTLRVKGEPGGIPQPRRDASCPDSMPVPPAWAQLSLALPRHRGSSAVHEQAGGAGEAAGAGGQQRRALRRRLHGASRRHLAGPAASASGWRALRAAAGRPRAQSGPLQRGQGGCRHLHLPVPPRPDAVRRHCPRWAAGGGGGAQGPPFLPAATASDADMGGLAVQSCG